MEYDVFISHASEDKDAFVRQIAKQLEAQQIMVWYDEFTLKPGSSLRRSIDFGLSKSRLGIVILSPNFFKKKWTNWELDGLVARQNSSENDLIIPIWLNLTRDELIQYSPPLADKVAILADEGIEAVIRKILQIVKPEGSTLVIARDLVYKSGFNPPMVTDDWWLDVIEYSGKEFLHHEYLAFEYPWTSWEPIDRGKYIASHALQKLWQEEADTLDLSQLTPPNVILEFIADQPGLKAVAMSQPQKLAFYFPQLTIRGYGGDFEPVFDELLNLQPKYGSKQCEEEVAFRHQKFGDFSPSELADIYFTGAGGGIGPSTRRHEQIDCIIWLLSIESDWMPANVKLILLEGLKKWAVWPWNGHSDIPDDCQKSDNSGTLQLALLRTKKPEKFKLTKKALSDIDERIRYSKSRLKLPETVEVLRIKFLQEQFIEEWIIERYGKPKRIEL